MRDLKTLGEDPELRGELRLGVASSAVAGVLCTLLLDLTKRHPHLELAVTKGTSSTLYAKLCDQQIDAALMFEPQFEIPKSFDWSPIRSEPYIAIAPSELRHRPALDLLREQPFIRYDRRLWSGQIAEQYLKRMEIAPRERLELDGLEAIAVLVNRGLGVSLVPDWSTPWPERLTLAKLPLPGRAVFRTLGMIWPRDSVRLLFIEHLRAIAGGG